MEYLECDALVIGSGIAGLLATRLLHDKGCRTIMACSSSFGSGASFFPLKGTLGIQVTGDAQNNALFKEDFLRVANGNIDRQKMQTYIEESNGHQELLRLIGFDPLLREDKRPACFANYSRPIYLIKDWNHARKTAKQIFESLAIPVLEETRAIKLFKEGNAICGALLKKKDSYCHISAKVVVLATGGIAGLFEHSLYPSDVDGSAWFLAADAGASLINSEFIQFIPAFMSPKYNVLFGEHTIKYLKNVYNHEGTDIFSDLTKNQKEKLFFERSSYAPFSVDYKSCLFDIRMFQAGSQGVRLEYSPELYNDTEAFYQIYLNWLTKEQGINLVNDNPVIAPFAHSSNGGIEITHNAQTSVDGLYTVGEASCGVEGANRMGGNSVGGIVVFTPRMAEHAYSYISGKSNSKNPNQAQDFINDLKKNEKKDSITPHQVLERVAHLLQKYACIIRTKEGLQTLIDQIHQLEKSFAIFPHHDTQQGFKALHALYSAQLMVTAMLNRNQSVGAHYREDYNKIFTIQS
ncbi:MAG: FAD-binding protein [Treponemataceae bacterium]